MKAIVLAAGMGTRLREVHDLPKGALKLGNQTIIEESLATLRQFGISETAIVTGYRGEFYESIARSTPGVRTFPNPRYSETGSLYSLYCARSWLDDDFLLLESDLIYEPSAIRTLLEHPGETVVLGSGTTGSGDEVYVEATDGLLLGMSKDRSALSSVAGELVGISKLSAHSAAAMFRVMQSRLDDGGKVDYESGLVALSKVETVSWAIVPDLVWSEIDDARQYARAIATIYPRIAAKRLDGLSSAR